MQLFRQRSGARFVVALLAVLFAAAAVSPAIAQVKSTTLNPASGCRCSAVSGGV